MTPRVSSYTVIFAVRYVPITVTGTVSTVTGTVSQFQTRGIPVRNLIYREVNHEVSREVYHEVPREVYCEIFCEVYREVFREVYPEVPCEEPNHNLTYQFRNGRYSPNDIFSCVNLESPQKMSLETPQSEKLPFWV